MTNVVSPRPSKRISVLEVGVAIGKMKQGKSAGPLGVVAEMLKAAGETVTLRMTEVCNEGLRMVKCQRIRAGVGW